MKLDYQYLSVSFIEVKILHQNVLSCVTLFTLIVLTAVL